MERINVIARVREKLDLYGKPYIDAVFLQKILDKFAPNYSIKQLCNLNLVRPIKRSTWYVNTKTREFINPFVIGGLYMGEEMYAFGGMAVYNRYSLSEQIAENYTIYNTKLSGTREIAGIRFYFVRQRESFFYGIKTEKLGAYSYEIMTPERACIQMLREGKTFRNIPKSVQQTKLVHLAEKYASKNLQSQIQQLCI